MYEPIRTKSVHTTPVHASDVPHRSREEELDIQLAGHLSALLAVTDELRAAASTPDLETAATKLAHQVTRLRGGRVPLRSHPDAGKSPAALHHRPAPDLVPLH
ncbi:SCO4983 family protein, partial [Streptomyces sp. S6]